MCEKVRSAPNFRRNFPTELVVSMNYWSTGNLPFHITRCHRNLHLCICSFLMTYGRCSDIVQWGSIKIPLNTEQNMVSYFGVCFSWSPKEKLYDYEMSHLFVYQPFQFGNDSRVSRFWENVIRFGCNLWEIWKKKSGCCSKLSCTLHPFTDPLNFKLVFKFSSLFGKFTCFSSLNLILSL